MDNPANPDPTFIEVAKQSAAESHIANQLSLDLRQPVLFVDIVVPARNFPVDCDFVWRIEELRIFGRSQRNGDTGNIRKGWYE